VAQVLAQEHVTLPALRALSTGYERKIQLLEERLQLRFDVEAKTRLQVEALEDSLDGVTKREALLILRVEKTEQRLSRARWIWASIGAGIVVVLIGGAWGLTAGL
jgi:hypothetical protein